ncbi:MAG: GAF domain-containing protein [Rhizobiaceae bacterium]|nr:GAF domain-containing protein [Rhizobiaceae bacterium]
MTEKTATRDTTIEEVLANQERLLATHKTGFAMAQRDKRFDHLAQIAGSVFNAPVSQVTLLGEQTQWFKSSIGFDLVEAPTRTSFCAHTISVDDLPLVIKDTSKDPFFKDNPFVTDPPHIRFYAGYPIWFMGEKVGTVCVYDFEPRDGITTEQITVIEQISEQASVLLKLAVREST